MQFRPLHDRVVVRRIDAEEKSKGGIIIPDTAKEKPQEGEVIAAGPRCPRRGPARSRPLDVKAGDRVLFGKWSGTEVRIDGEDLLIMKESDIMGVIEQDRGEERRPDRLPFRSAFHLTGGKLMAAKTYASPPTPATSCCAAWRSSTTP
jgi:chaperonin GroES